MFVLFQIKLFNSTEKWYRIINQFLKNYVNEERLTNPKNLVGIKEIHSNTDVFW